MVNLHLARKQRICNVMSNYYFFQGPQGHSGAQGSPGQPGPVVNIILAIAQDFGTYRIWTNSSTTVNPQIFPRILFL